MNKKILHIFWRALKSISMLLNYFTHNGQFSGIRVCQSIDQSDCCNWFHFLFKTACLQLNNIHFSHFKLKHMRPFMKACFSNNLSRLRQLAKCGQTQGKEKALHRVCAFGNLKIVRWILRTFPNINVNKDVLFENACKNGHLNVVKWLFKNYNIRPRSQSIGLRNAYSQNRLNIFKWFLTVYKGTTGYNLVYFVNHVLQFRSMYFPSTIIKFLRRTDIQYISAARFPNKRSVCLVSCNLI
jgi:hypothetical protein